MSRNKAFPKTRPRHLSDRPSAQRKIPPGASFLASPRRLYATLSGLLAAVTIALYSPVFSHTFIVLDDREYVTANPHIHTLGWSTIKWAFTSTDAANWHPLTWLSHAVDFQLFALNAAGHHFDGVLIHALNAVLLFLLLAWVTNQTGPSLLVAALFAVHPINVESVAWIAERKNVLSTFFFFLALGAYAWYAQKPNWRRYLAVACLFAASLMAKPMAVTFPFLLLLLDYWPLRRLAFGDTQSAQIGATVVPHASLSRLVLEKIPLLLLSAASSWATMKAQHTVVRTFDEFSLATRIENALSSYGLYLWKMVWPASLAFYPHSIFGVPASQWVLSALVLISITAFVLIFHNKRYLPVGWFWFLGTLIPVIGLVQVGEQSMADRYAYIPLIGIFIMIAWGLADVAQARNVRMAWCGIPALCALAALAAVTYRQTNYWESDYDLWSHALALQESPFAHNAVAMALMNPDSEMSKQDLADFSSQPARIEEARRHFERALELRRFQGADASLWDRARTLNNLGNIDRIENRLDEARQHDEEALVIYRRLAQQNPDEYLQYLAGMLSNLGSIDRAQNRPQEARQHFESALEIDRQLAQQHPAKYSPNLALVLNEFAMADATDNQMEAARGHFEEALAIDRQLVKQNPGTYLPDLGMTLTNFALLDAVQHRMDAARQHYEEALDIERKLAEQNPDVYLPNVAMTLTNLGRVDRMEGNSQEARAHYEEALNILRKLASNNNQYAGDVARAEANLEALPKLPQ